MSSEVKVGLLFFLGLALLLWFTLMVNKVSPGGGDFDLNFPRVAKLKEGDAVNYNGVRIGTVTEVAPILDAGKPRVRVRFSVDSRRRASVLIDNDARFAISQQMLGGSALEILARGGVPITKELLVGRLGQDPASLDEVIAALQKLVEDNRAEIGNAISTIRTAAARFGELAEEAKAILKENRPKLKESIDRLPGTVANVSGAAGEIRDAVNENRPNLKTTVAKLPKVADNLAGAASEVRDAVNENRPDLKATVAKLPGMADRISGAAGEIRDTVAENRPNVRTTLANVARFSERLDHIGANFQVVTDQIAAGKGTVGKLVFEDTIHEKGVLALDSFQSRLEEVKPVTQGMGDVKLYAGLMGGGDANTGAYEAHAYLRIEPKPWKFYTGGIGYRSAPKDRDAARDDPNKFNLDVDLLIGWRFFPSDRGQHYGLTVAGGVINSQLGGYVQVPLWQDRLSVVLLTRGKDFTRAESDRRYEEPGAILVRATAEYRIWDRVVVSAGVNDLINRPGAWFALRAELLDNDLRNLVTVAGLKL